MSATKKKQTETRTTLRSSLLEMLGRAAKPHESLEDIFYGTLNELLAAGDTEGCVLLYEQHAKLIETHRAGSAARLTDLSEAATDGDLEANQAEAYAYAEAADLAHYAEATAEAGRVLISTLVAPAYAVHFTPIRPKSYRRPPANGSFYSHVAANQGASEAQRAVRSADNMAAMRAKKKSFASPAEIAAMRAEMAAML